MTTRMWGAVWKNGRPVAEIRDVIWDYATMGHTPDYRWWALEVLDKSTKNRKKDHSDPKCGPGNECQKCHQQAAWWWFEWQNRCDTRRFTPAKQAARERVNGWSAADWGQPFDLLSDAMANATDIGFPLVWESDGHGRLIAWHEVNQ